MKKQCIHLPLILLFFAGFTAQLFAATEEAKTEEEGEFDVTEMIMHHIKDSYDWHMWDFTNKDGKEVVVSLPLPVILYYDGHLDVFMSSAFHHGHSKVVKGDRVYELLHSKIIASKGNVKTHGRASQHSEGRASQHAEDRASQHAEGRASQHAEDRASHVDKDTEIADHDADHQAEGDSFLDFSITRNVAAMMISCLILLLIFITAARHYKKNPDRAPKGIAGFMEPLILFIRDDVAVPNIGEEKAGRFMGYLLTVFFFILINNLLGLIPVFPGASNVTGNIAVTMVLAVITFLITNLNGSSDYWKHMFWPDGIPKWILPILVPVEVIGIFTKPFALMVRLFANITAGHIIILSLISLIFIFQTEWISPLSIAFALFMSFLEILVAFLQAYIFTMLSALFIGMAVQKHH